MADNRGNAGVPRGAGGQGASVPRPNPKSKPKPNPKPKRPKRPQLPAGPGPGATGYNPYLGYGTSFNWGGRSWSGADADAFARYMGPKRYTQWLRNHPNAGRVFNPVDQQIYGQVAPQLQQLEYERKQREAFNQRRMHDLAGFTQAVMGMLGEIAPAIRGAYGEGAQTMESGGTGYGDVLNQALGANAAAGNSLLDVLGAPEGAQIQGGDAGGVLAGLAGWVPATMMGEQGKAYGDAAAQLPKTASITSQMEMRSLLAQAQQDDEDFRQQIQGVLSGLPGARQDLLQQRAAQNQAQVEFRMKKLADERDWWLKKQALYISQGRLDLARQAEKRAQSVERRMTMETAGRDAWGDPMPGYTVDPRTGGLIPPGYKVDKQGNVVKVGSSGGGAKFTPGQVQDQITKVDASKDDISASIKKQYDRRLPGMGPHKNEKAIKAAIAKAVFKEWVHLAPSPRARKRLRAVIAALMRDGLSGSDSGSGDSFWDD